VANEACGGATFYVSWFIFCPQTANCKAVGGAVVHFGSDFSRRLPMVKLLAALLSFLVHILSAYCRWRSCWRRCCLFWFIFCPQTAKGEAFFGGAVVYFGSYFVRRLAVAKLVAALLSTQLPGVNPALAATDTLNLLLDLFFKYSLNNFLHAQVPPLFFFNTVWSGCIFAFEGRHRKAVFPDFGSVVSGSSRSRFKKAKIFPKKGKNEELHS
jgi:hypothetical protein